VKSLDDAALIECLDAALGGEADALETLLAALKDPLFRLALRTLGNFTDAEDATQEILIKIMTALSTFQRRSSLRTWAFRIAINHLHDIAARRRPPTESFDAIAAQLEKGFAVTADFTQHASADPLLELEAREVGLHCTQGILMRLDIEQRLAYVLSEVFDFDTKTAAQILGISDAAYRQRLSRGRRELDAFMGERCGLVNANARCSCARQAEASRRVRGGRPVPIKFTRGDDPQAFKKIEQARTELSRLQRIAVVFRTSPEWSAPDTLLHNVRRVLNSSPLLQPPTGEAT
jgi:RNA polymerase sigma factor (sigma-70 family)